MNVPYTATANTASTMALRITLARLALSSLASIDRTLTVAYLTTGGVSKV